MKIQITQPAAVSLKDIYQYYKQNVSKEIADKIKKNILDTIKTLKTNPHIGQIEENLKELNLGHRRLIEGNYKIIYRITDKVIYVTDIFDSRQDPSRMKS